MQSVQERYNIMPTKPKKRGLILDTALILFNEQGSHTVTTNHIAKAMGISPGNLYYHFKNKEHIIRELLARLINGFDAMVTIQADVNSVPEFVNEIISSTSRLIFGYRFIYSELAALLTRDKLFRAMYHDIKAKRAKEFGQLFNTLTRMGIFQDITRSEQNAVMFIIWTYAEGLITALHTSNIPVTQSAIETHFKNILYILKAYLEPPVWTAIANGIRL